MSNTPSDAEIVAVMRDGYNCRYNDEQDHIDFARAVLARWGAQQPNVEPDFYTACAWYEDGGEGGWIALPGYSNETEHGVKHLVLEAARKEGWKGTATGRLMALGWEIRPVYFAPHPVAREPLTDEQITEIWAAKVRYHAAPIGSTDLEFARDIERAHGIGTKKGDSHGLQT